jgi:hypothetical protein
MDRMRFTSVSEARWQSHDRGACQVDRHNGHGAILPRASSMATAAMAASLSSTGSSDALTAKA